MKRYLTRLAILMALAAPAGSAGTALDCGTDTPCEIANGSYYLVLPEGWDGEAPLPAIVFFHGHRASGKSILNGSVRKVFGAAGYAIIAPNGPRRAGADYRYWPARPMARPPRDNIAFTVDVVEDVARRVPLERGRLLVGGFSAGGSMAWRVACDQGDAFAGYVSVAGALRRPVPRDGCPGGPARMLHIHGFTDRQVPLEGRAIRDWHQGDVFESLALLRQANRCPSNPDSITRTGNASAQTFSCRAWSSCASGQDIRFCLHDGGHGLPRGWAEMALEWFENAPGG